MSSREEQGGPGRQEQGGAKGDNGPAAVEWLVGGVAALLVLSGIGFLVDEALRGTASPPMIGIEVKDVLAQPMGGYVVEIVALNRGGTTARGLVIEGKLLEMKQESSGGQQNGGDERKAGPGPLGGKEVETATATLSWVPAHADRKGGLFFDRDPREYRLEVSPQGYESP